ncbi:GtrA family protein [Haloarchaeobius sp. HRN-SO-5]|uniref:GtrA family protein n=1 Tax=Haloarchaeobius sp. HRN-SO-5 TaxID=3446118 RepID=UPI003EBEAEFD
MIRAFLRNLESGPYAPQLRRYVVVGTVAAGVQLVVLWMLVDLVGANYLLGAVLAIESTIVLSYALNNAWTFSAAKNTGSVEYLVGLLKTNVVRATAMPIQLGILLLLVELGGVSYLAANAAAIGGSGIYRYVLEARWTWG